MLYEKVVPKTFAKFTRRKLAIETFLEKNCRLKKQSSNAGVFLRIWKIKKNSYSRIPANGYFYFKFSYLEKRQYVE